MRNSGREHNGWLCQARFHPERLDVGDWPGMKRISPSAPEPRAQFSAHDPLAAAATMGRQNGEAHASGIHHVTSIAGSARRNLDFYTGTLGLRLIKKTVNFDDPGSYHLYYGDAAGSPGTILTFFPGGRGARPAGNWRGAGDRLQRPGRFDRLLDLASHREGRRARSAPQAVRRNDARVKDRDGTRLALAGVRGVDEGAPGWSAAETPPEHAIRGFHSVSLLLAEAAPTAAILTDVFGFVADGREGSTQRYRAPGVEVGGLIDLRTAGEFLMARQARRLVHHVAFRAADDAAQAAMVEKLVRRSSSAHDRAEGPQLFPLGLFPRAGPGLFEIATDPPGFAGDEPMDLLGQALKLPPFLEGRRAQIEAALPKLD